MRLDPVTELKRCSKCKVEKSPEEFKSDKKRLDGLYCYCRECERAYSRAHIKKEKTKATRSVWLKNHLEVAMFHNAHDRASKQSLPFTITKEDISVPTACPICHCLLESGDGKQRMNSPSLDKWNPLLGYTRDNIWVICMRCNLRKGDMSGEELLDFATRTIDAFKDRYDRMA